MSIFNMKTPSSAFDPVTKALGKATRKALYPTINPNDVDPGEPPAPAPIPTPADPGIKAAIVEADRAAGKRQGRASTTLAQQGQIKTVGPPALRKTLATGKVYG